MFQNNVLRSFSFHMEIDKGILNFSKGRNRIYYWCFCANDKNNSRCRTGSNLCHALSGFVIYWCKVLLIESNCDKVNDFDKILKWQCFKALMMIRTHHLNVVYPWHQQFLADMSSLHVRVFKLKILFWVISVCGMMNTNQWNIKQMMWIRENYTTRDLVSMRVIKHRTSA